MALTTRTRLGPYEIVAPLAAGGMGEIYRARDTRLGRDVAIKIVAPRYAAEPDRLGRFEREARVASSLNHANIVTIHDVGVSELGCYIAMELVPGTPLSTVLQRAPLPVPQMLDIAAQIADGLAAAHASGIVHRDLKPSNVMVRPDGRVKIVDFGVAKLATVDAATDDDASTAMLTEPAHVLGSPPYMSPEQVLGNPVDFRSDQFSFGSMLYEMATGKKPFTGSTVPQTLLAIAGDEPEDVGSLNPKIPAPLRWAIHRCLAKDPDHRYAATEDLARDLRTLREHLHEATDSIAVVSSRSAATRWVVVSAIALACLIVGAAGARLLTAPPASPPSFHLLTFQRGDVLGARFAPDGRSIVYAFSSGGLPTEVYAAPVEGSQFRPLGLSDTQLLAVSRSGELAVALGWRWNSPYTGTGTLARLLPDGGAPRPIADNVALADWTADGKELAVVRFLGRLTTLEFPIGKVLYQAESEHGIFEMRVSPRGDRIGIVVLGASYGSFSVLTVDLAGHRRVLSDGWRRVQGLAWTPDGSELWFAGTKSGMTEVDTLYSATPNGRPRIVARFPGSIAIDDVGTDGRALLTQAKVRREMMGVLAGDTREHDLTWLDYSFPVALTADGRHLLFDESGEGVSTRPSLWLRTSGASAPQRLGDGDAGSTLSPDGRWAAALQPVGNDRMELRLIPTGAGEERSIPLPGVNPNWTLWSPDGRRLIVNGNEAGRKVRSYVVGLNGQPLRPVTPEGSIGCLISPDTRWLLAGVNGLPTLFPIDGGEPHSPALPGLQASVREAIRDVTPLAWADDDHSIFVAKGGVPAEILRLDLSTGRTTFWKQIAPADVAGVRSVDVNPQLIAPSAHAYVATFRRVLSDLYLVEGLR